MDHLTALLSELSAQLTANRAQCASLSRQAEDLKIQASHAGSGFTLRRFNVDISQEQFETELERLNATLVSENHGIQNENRQLNALLKDYEQTLESVMSRFRGFAHSTQTHELELARHYESLLLEAQSQQVQSNGALGNGVVVPETNTAASQAIAKGDPVAVVPVAELDHLAATLRRAYRAMNGEVTHDDDDEDAEDDEERRKGSADIDGGGYHALMDGSSRNDRALENEIELERLRRENDSLRKMLQVAQTDELTS